MKYLILYLEDLCNILWGTMAHKLDHLPQWFLKLEQDRNYLRATTQNPDPYLQSF